MSTLDMIILVLLMWGIWKGYRRGFILQVFHLLGFLVAYLIAFRYYKEISPHLKAWIPYPLASKDVARPLWMQLVDTEMLYYSFLAFAILFFGTKIILRVIAQVLNVIALFPGLNMANRWLGVSLGLVEMLLITLIGVHLLRFIPWETGQDLLAKSTLALWLIEETSFIFTFFQDFWLH